MSEVVLRIPENHTDSENCKCRPDVEVQPNGNRLVIHNAWDGREFYEEEE